MKKMISVFLMVCLLLSIVPLVTPVEATSVTQAQALSWARSKIGVGLDYDKAWGNQCVDLIYYYYEYLGVSPIVDGMLGNARHYQTNTVPAGWERITTNIVPQPGDIAVWHAWITTPNGVQITYDAAHIGIVTSGNASTFSLIHQNYAGSTVCVETSGVPVSYLYCVIRPFSNGSSSTPSDPWLGWDVYADKHWIGTTNAVLGAWVNMNIDNSLIQKCGVELYDYEGNRVGGMTENWNGSGGYSYFYMWYDVNSELGYTLTPGAPFSYQFFLVIYGKTYYSPYYTDTTSGTHTHNYNSGVVTKEPTCTATGTRVRTCTLCGTTTTETISKKSHSYQNATCTSPKTCTVCGTTSGSALGHSWKEATYTEPKTCTVCGTTSGSPLVRTYIVSYYGNGGFGAPNNQIKTHGQALILTSAVPTREGYTFLGWSASNTATSATYQPGDRYTANESVKLYAVWKQRCLATVESWNVVLEDNLKVNFYVRVSGPLSDTTKIKVTFADEAYAYLVKDLGLDENGCYLISFKIAAAQMNDKIVIVGIDGEQDGIASYTVRQYCDTILANSSYSQYHALVKAMLNYGAMAQKYFGYNATNLANQGITGAADAAVPSTVNDLKLTDNTDNLDFYGASLVYRDKIAVRFYFTGDVADCIFVSQGKICTPVAKDGMYYIEIADILPQDLDDQITLTVIDPQGGTISVTYGPMNYIVRMNAAGSSDLKNLLKALYNYHLAAKAMV